MKSPHAETIICSLAPPALTILCLCQYVLEQQEKKVNIPSEDGAENAYCGLFRLMLYRPHLGSVLASLFFVSVFP